MLENELVDKICQHFLRILKQSKQENEAELLMLLNILKMFLANCENNVSVSIILSIYQKKSANNAVQQIEVGLKSTVCTYCIEY